MSHPRWLRRTSALLPLTAAALAVAAPSALGAPGPKGAPIVVGETLAEGEPMRVQGRPAVLLAGFSRGATIMRRVDGRPLSGREHRRSTLELSRGRAASKETLVYCFKHRVQAAEVRHLGVTWGKIWNHTSWCASLNGRDITYVTHRTDTYHGPAWCISLTANTLEWEAGRRYAFLSHSAAKIENLTPFGCGLGEQTINADISASADTWYLARSYSS
jgi:hypothetical protein